MLARLQLNVFNNVLIRVPATLAMLDRLDELNLGGNRCGRAACGHCKARAGSGVPQRSHPPFAWQAPARFECPCLCRLKAVPELKHSKTLTRLSLHWNTLVVVAPLTAQSDTLGTLQLQGNALKELPRIGRAPLLQVRDATGSGREALRGAQQRPHSLYHDAPRASAHPHLAALQIVDASCNDLVSLPDDIHKWSALVSLNLASNALFALPDAIGALTLLEELKVRRAPWRRLGLRRDACVPRVS